MCSRSASAQCMSAVRYLTRQKERQSPPRLGRVHRVYNTHLEEPDTTLNAESRRSNIYRSYFDLQQARLLPPSPLRRHCAAPGSSPPGGSSLGSAARIATRPGAAHPHRGGRTQYMCGTALRTMSVCIASVERRSEPPIHVQ